MFKLAFGLSTAVVCVAVSLLVSDAKTKNQQKIAESLSDLSGHALLSRRRQLAELRDDLSRYQVYLQSLGNSIDLRIDTLNLPLSHPIVVRLFKDYDDTKLEIRRLEDRIRRFPAF